MLVNLLDGWFKIDVGEGAFYSVFGFIFVFLGIALLIAIFTALGLIMKKVNSREKSPKTAKKEKGAQRSPASVAQKAPVAEEGLSPELIAVITAAIAAYYEGTKEKCDFVVRRIKRL